jgi:hypothetical protein
MWGLLIKAISPRLLYEASESLLAGGDAANVRDRRLFNTYRYSFPAALTVVSRSTITRWRSSPQWWPLKIV